jgi:hypothetical protein
LGSCRPASSPEFRGRWSALQATPFPVGQSASPRGPSSEGLSRRGALSATPDGSGARERTVLWTPWLLYSRRHPIPYLAYVRVSFSSLAPSLPPSGLRQGAAGSSTGTCTHPRLRLRSIISCSELVMMVGLEHVAWVLRKDCVLQRNKRDFVRL